MRCRVTGLEYDLSQSFDQWTSRRMDKQTRVAKTFLAKYLDVSSERHCCCGTQNHSNAKRAEPHVKGTSVANPTHGKLLPQFHSHSCKALVFHSSLLWVPSQSHPSGG